MDKPQSAKGFINCNSNDIEHQLRCISTILDGLDALVYVADMQTYELIFFNKYGIKEWGKPNGEPCYKVLQQGQEAPCNFCSNNKLIDAKGQPTGVYVWEFQNTVNGRWYQCRDQAVPWVDGRLVRMEIATDITEGKLMELELKRLNKLANESARTDPLLNCLNRRAFFETGKAMFSHCERQKNPLAIVMMDVDRFKVINDSYGHAFGDDVLVKMVDVIQDSIRDEDIFARYGGEEFVLLLPDTDEKEALMLLERLHANLRKVYFSCDIHNIKVTMSFGLAYHRAGSSLDSLLKESDVALYQAKADGRDCIRVYKPD